MFDFLFIFSVLSLDEIKMKYIMFSKCELVAHLPSTEHHHRVVTEALKRPPPGWRRRRGRPANTWL